MTFGIGERGLGAQRACGSVDDARQTGDAALVLVFRSVLHHERHVGQCGYVLFFLVTLHAGLHLRLDNGFRDRELCVHRGVAAEDGEVGGWRNLVAGAYGNLADDTGHGSRDGAEAEVHPGAVDRRLCLGYCGPGLADGSRCLVVAVAGILKHIGAHNLLVEQVLVALILQLGAVGLCLSCREVGLCSLEVGTCGLHFVLGIARVDNKQCLPLAHALAFADAYSHQLSAHLRRDSHVGLTFQLGAEFHGKFNVGFLNGNRFERCLFLFGYVKAACCQYADGSAEHHYPNQNISTFHVFSMIMFLLCYFLELPP